MKARRIAALLSLLACTTEAAGQTVAGTVVDGASGRRLGRAAVVVLDAAGDAVFAGYADSLGAFSAPVPAPGAYRLEIGQIGYVAAVLPRLDVPAGDPVFVRVELPPSPIRIPGVDVLTTARTAPVERARTVAVARLDRVEIEALLPAAEVSTLLRRLPSANLRIARRPRDPGSSIYDLCIEAGRGVPDPSGGCRWPAVYIDGTRALAPEEQLTLLSASDIASIEYLPPTLAGARYGAAARYGVLLIETMR